MITVLIFVFGLLIGSFLNVVVYRLPIMLKQQWQIEVASSENLNLFFPRSHCPNCNNTISVFENIPLLSYVYLKGKCKHCQHKINFTYPLLEIITAIISVLVVQHYGLTLQAAATLIFSFSLLTLAFIDLKTFLLPDIITLPLLWLGLLCNLWGLFTDINSAVFGAAAGYFSLWSVAKLFEIFTGKIGMANGDFKLLAAFGAWLGWQWLAPIVFVASVSGAVISLILIFFKKHSREKPIPFGPYLAFAGFLILMLSHVGAPLVGALSGEANTSIGDIVGAFKSITTNQYIYGVKNHGWAPFDKKFWQRNYYEHIIRNEESLSKIRQYIADNPISWQNDKMNTLVFL